MGKESMAHVNEKSRRCAVESEQPAHAGYRRRAQMAVRKFHQILLKRKLSERLAICFHEVLPADYDRFRELANHFKMAGYVFVDAAGLCADGAGKRVFLSFDDNYRSWTDLLKILDESEISATFFVSTAPFRDLVSRTLMNCYFDRIKHYGERISLSTAEVRDLAAAGHRIGCHSHLHVDLTRLTLPRLEHEIDRSKSILEDLIGQQVIDFAYPFGMRRNFSERLRNYCLNVGFQTISNAIPGLQYAPHRPASINRTRWEPEKDLAFNIDNLRVDGRVFEKLTGRSPIG
jgi:peptidoglycan/xylan/chitin deacetylase (PgdA/CDA1 family)